MTFIKQGGDESRKPKKTNKPAKAAQPAPIDHAADYRKSHSWHSSCVEEALDGLKGVISTWVTQERNGDNGSSLYSSPNAYPVKVELVESPLSEALHYVAASLDPHMESLATAVERIAVAFEGIADAMI